MQVKFKRPNSMRDRPMHYCPGCGHGIVHRLICEVVDELGIREEVIGISPVGCSVIAYDYFDFDMVEVAHGRAPAGMAEIVHAASRGEAFNVIFINNANYGMTGGQMAPTTLVGQRTATTPFGRDVTREGYPLRMPELLASLPGVYYLERVAVNNPANVRRTKRAIKKSFLVQMEKKRFSLVEVLSPCPTNWRLSPLEALKWLEEKMIPYYPLRVIKDLTPSQG